MEAAAAMMHRNKNSRTFRALFHSRCLRSRNKCTSDRAKFITFLFYSQFRIYTKHCTPHPTTVDCRGASTLRSYRQRVSEWAEIIEEYARMLIAFARRYHSMKLNYSLVFSLHCIVCVRRVRGVLCVGDSSTTYLNDAVCVAAGCRFESAITFSRSHFRSVMLPYLLHKRTLRGAHIHPEGIKKSNL